MVVEGNDPSTDSVAAVARPVPTVVASVIEQFPDATYELRRYASSSVTYHAIAVPVRDWVAFAQAARDAGFDTFIDIAAVDHYIEAPRFEVALNVLNMEAVERIVVSTRVPYDQPSVPTLTEVFPGANFYEREAFDLIGVEFPDHPDLTRILLPDDWEGHPLRKDYAVGSVPVEFKAGSADL